MRKNCIHEAKLAEDRNMLIDFLNSKEAAIVVSHQMLLDNLGELNKVMKKEKHNTDTRDLATTIGLIGGGLLSVITLNPVPLLVGIGGTAASHKIFANELKGYDIYIGNEQKNEVLVLLNRSVIDLEYDTINYPFEVIVNYKKRVNRKKVKVQNSYSDKFECEIYVNTREEGGRHTPFFNNYMPRFRFDNFEVTGIITLPKDMEMCLPGNTVRATVEFKTALQINCGDRFVVVEGRKKDEKIVGIGIVIDIAE